MYTMNRSSRRNLVLGWKASVLCYRVHRELSGLADRQQAALLGLLDLVLGALVVEIGALVVGAEHWLCWLLRQTTDWAGPPAHSLSHCRRGGGRAVAVGSERCCCRRRAVQCSSCRRRRRQCSRAGIALFYGCGGLRTGAPSPSRLPVGAPRLHWRSRRDARAVEERARRQRGCAWCAAARLMV